MRFLGRLFACVFMISGSLLGHCPIGDGADSVTEDTSSSSYPSSYRTTSPLAIPQQSNGHHRAGSDVTTSTQSSSSYRLYHDWPGSSSPVHVVEPVSPPRPARRNPSNSSLTRSGSHPILPFASQR